LLKVPDPERPAAADPLAPIRITVPAEAGGQRVDQFLARVAGIGARSWVKDLALAGGVRIDGRPARPGSTVEAGQEVTVRPDALAVAAVVEPAVPAPAHLEVLYEDADLLVIDKPPGLAAHRPDGRRRDEPNLADLAVRLFGPLSLAGGEDRPGIVHRLDKETSGVMVLARSDEAMHFLKAQFRARTVQKEYRALTYGVPRFDSDWIERNLAPHPQKGDRIVVVQEGGREAQTFYEVLERFAGFAHLRCRPKTGRTHQIRVHLQSIGHSLVGDRQYRSRNAQARRLPDGAPDPGRQCLHARSLVFEHPRTREQLGFEAAIPADFAALLAWLRAQLPA
jgi:23S rRNA pseudouridine1911/1915/1917 synthase